MNYNILRDAETVLPENSETRRQRHNIRHPTDNSLANIILKSITIYSRST